MDNHITTDAEVQKLKYAGKEISASNYFRACELLRGKNIIRKHTMEVVPRLIFLAVLGYENKHDYIKTILAGAHPLYEVINKPGWENGSCVSMKTYENYIITAVFDYEKNWVE